MNIIINELLCSINLLSTANVMLDNLIELAESREDKDLLLEQRVKNFYQIQFMKEELSELYKKA